MTVANGHAEVANVGLLAQHVALLEASAIKPDVAAARGYRSAIQAGELDRLGFAPEQRRVPGLLIPVHDVWGEIAYHQLRPDEPRTSKGKPVKYESASKRSRARRSLPARGWVIDVPPRARQDLGSVHVPLWITEGARKADAGVSAGLCCIDLVGVWGFRNRRQGDEPPTPLQDWDTIALQGRRVYLVFDSDVTVKASVRGALEALKALLDERGADTRIAYLPAGEGGAKVGLDDYLAQGHDERDLLELVESDLRASADGDGNGASRAKRLVDEALGRGAELFHTPAGLPYATVPVGSDEHHETMALASSPFKHWLRRLLYEAGDVASAQAVTDASSQLEAAALYDGPEHEVHVRVAGRQGTVYIDLGDTSWQAIAVDHEGWRLVQDPPVKFRRSPAMRPLPEPISGGSVDELRPFINVPDDEQWVLVVAWLVAALAPSGPYPLLVLHGEQGTAKSTAAKLLRSLVDPARPELRGEPDTINNLMVAAAGNWLLAYDNLSGIRPDFSDAFCRLSTGGGHAVRAHYTNDEEALFDAQRPLIFTGIEALPHRPDLLERALLIELPRIAPSERQAESDLLAAFEQCRPRILGALIAGLSSAISRRSEVALAELPRMADFARLGAAAERGLGFEPGAFLAAYATNRRDATSEALDASALWPYVSELADGEARTARELLAALEERVPESVRKRKAWPKAPSALSGQMRRLGPSLRSAGFEIDFGSAGRGNGRQKTISLSRAAQGSGKRDPIDPIDPTALQSHFSGSTSIDPAGVGSTPNEAGVDGVDAGSMLRRAETAQNSGMGSMGSAGSAVSRSEGQESLPCPGADPATDRP